MPELPEVETTRRGLAPLIKGHTITGIVVRKRRLRRPLSPTLGRVLVGQTVTDLTRRGKYLLLTTDSGTLILHLGMSGSLRVVPVTTSPGAHDHLDIVFERNLCVRLRDPRRFSLVVWTQRDPADHALLSRLGPEPLTTRFDGDYLYQRTRGRRAAIKSLIMDGHIVAGIGNIYANEALFQAGIYPNRAAGRISRARCRRLAETIKDTLTRALSAGGTTLQDFRNSNGNPGYFSVALRVYGKAGEPCPACGVPLRHMVIAQRSSVYCPRCQS